MAIKSSPKCSLPGSDAPDGAETGVQVPMPARLASFPPESTTYQQSEDAEMSQMWNRALRVMAHRSKAAAEQEE